MTSTKDILSNPDLNACPSQCFRPVGLAWGRNGRLFMSSDASGEIYVLTSSDFSATTTNPPSSSPTNLASHPTLASTGILTAFIAVAISIFLAAGLFGLAG
jgi:hypothetical protein